MPFFLFYVISTFIPIMKYRLLNMQSDCIFKKLFYIPITAGDPQFDTSDQVSDNCR